MTRELQDRARELMKNNEWESAIACLQQAQEKEPRNPYILDPLAFSYSRLRRHEEATALYQTLCQLQPQNARWPYMLGYQYYDQQLYGDAIPHFERALTLNPDYIVVLYRMGYALGTQEGKRGAALTTLEKCRSAYQRLTDDDTKNRERKHYIDACYQQGKLFLEAGNQRLAQERLREAVELNPEHVDAYYSLGQSYLKSEQFSNAIEVLTKAHKLSSKPEHYIIDRLAQAFAGAKQLERALETYERAPAFIRNRDYILRHMGELYIEANAWGKAASVLQEAVQRDRKNHNGHYLLGQVFQQQGEWQKAIQAFQRAIDLRRKNYNLVFPDAELALEALKNQYSEAILLDRDQAKISLPQSKSGRPVGCITKYFGERGFGFLQTASGQDIFFHIRNVANRQSVSVGEYAEYTLAKGRKGDEAQDIQIVAQHQLLE